MPSETPEQRTAKPGLTEELLINQTPHETRIALVIQGALQEVQVERNSHRGLVGNIYSGRVARVLPGMQSAFIDIGLERAAFLHVADVWQAKQAKEHAKELAKEQAREAAKDPSAAPAGPTRQGGNNGYTPIEKLLFEGQSLLVQVIKDPIGTKGARLSTQISIAGRLLVYLPHDPHIGISQRIENETERDALRQRLHAAIPADEKGGYIVRTAAEDASTAAFKADTDYLRLRWREILEASRTRPSPSLLYQELSLGQRALRDYATEATTAILVDSPDKAARLREFAKTYIPSVAERVQVYGGDRPLFDLYGVEDEIQRALQRRVDLKSGGYLILDQTEALTTIDVNTGGFVSGRNFDDTIFKTNLEAAHAIARQLRLRNLGGIIIIDFIDMESIEHRQAVLAELRKALSRDRTRVAVNGFTSLGLVEMTRKRTRESLAHVLCETCPTCQGRGAVKTPQTICYEILREISRMARQFNPKEFRILASQEVIDRFLEEESQHLAALGDGIAKPISLSVEPIYHQEQYDIVLV